MCLACPVPVHHTASSPLSRRVWACTAAHPLYVSQEVASLVATLRRPPLLLVLLVLLLFMRMALQLVAFRVSVACRLSRVTCRVSRVACRVSRVGTRALLTDTLVCGFVMFFLAGDERRNRGRVSDHPSSRW